MSELSVDAVNMLGKVTAEFRDAEARLKGLAIQEAATKQGMATARAEWQEESENFAKKKAAFLDELAKAKDSHDKSVAQREHAIETLVSEGQDRASKLIADAKTEIATQKANATLVLTDIKNQINEKTQELAKLVAEHEAKSAILANIHDQAHSILGRANA